MCSFLFAVRISQTSSNGTFFIMLEHVTEIESALTAWEAVVLPLNYTCMHRYLNKKYIIIQLLSKYICNLLNQ